MDLLLGPSMNVFVIKGCGVTLLCEQGQEMLDWITYMVDRGGVPAVTKWSAHS